MRVAPFLNSAILGLSLGITIILGQLYILPPSEKPASHRSEDTTTYITRALNQAKSVSRPKMQTTFKPAIDHAAPSVVNIYTTKITDLTQNLLFDDPFFRKYFGIQPPATRERMQSSLGSGVIVDKKGYILTNNHVISDADEIVVVLFDGREIPAHIIGMDPDTDLAILKIEAEDLPAIDIKKSVTPEVGDIVLAIGNPFGVGQTITMGIVSATGRSGLQLSTYEDYIQTDAAINPGNSGGALIDAAGDLVGINTAIYSKSGGSQGIGFAIPTNIASSVMEQIIKRGSVVRGWLGIIPQAITKNLADSFGVEYVEGVVIADIFREGPAEKAGILPGDILTHINDNPVEDLRRVMIQIAEYQPGDIVQIDLIRRGESIRKSVTMGKRP